MPRTFLAVLILYFTYEIQDYLHQIGFEAVLRYSTLTPSNVKKSPIIKQKKPRIDKYLYYPMMISSWDVYYFYILQEQDRANTKYSISQDNQEIFQPIQQEKQIFFFDYIITVSVAQSYTLVVKRVLLTLLFRFFALSNCRNIISVYAKIA